MRDYDFGNRLTDLRKARGFSQFQLGTLVGVTDKAVSKWETGAAKPRMDVMMKLAAVLGVGLEDFLADAGEEYPKDCVELTKKKNDLWKKAETKMREFFGDTPDLVVRNRFLTEKNALGNSDEIVLFDTMSMLKAYTDGMNTVFTPRGVVGCSFVAWLLGATAINPLPSHYRCQHCQRIIYMPESNCGWDLPEKECTLCGEKMIRDGHDLPFEISVCGQSNPLISVDCNVDNELIDKAWEMVLEYLSPYYTFVRRREPAWWDKEYFMTRLFLLKNKGGDWKSIEDIPELEEKTYHDFLCNVPSLFLYPVSCDHAGKNAGIRNPEDLIRPARMKKALLEFIEEQRRADEENKRSVDDQTSEEKDYRWLPKPEEEIRSFSRFVSVIDAIHGTYKGPGPDELAKTYGLDDYLQLPLSREDIWHLIHRCSGNAGNLTGIASEIIYKTRTGKYSNNLTEDDKKLFEQLNLPVWFADFVQQVLYLFPRCHDVAIAYQMLLLQG